VERWEYAVEMFMPIVEGKGMLSGVAARDRALQLIVLFEQKLCKRGADGWEYVRQESLSTRTDVFGAAKDESLTVLVFRRML